MNIKIMENNEINGKMKCAEIYYQRSEFTIICGYCGLKTTNYQKFMIHFVDNHCLVNNNMDDMDDDEEDVDADADADTNGDPLDIITITDNENNATDDQNIEYLKKPKKYIVIPVVNKNRSQNINPKPPCGIEEIEETDTEPVQILKKQSTSEEEQKNNKEKDTLEINGIDWSKPYAPNSLNHYNKRPYKPRNKQNTCSFCGRVFKRRNQLDNHLNIHTGLKPHQCDICGRQFRAVTTLKRHLNTHEQRNSFQCQHCDKHFTHRAALVSHELRHTQKRNIPCNECDALFYTLNQMDTHKRKLHQNHNTEPPQPLPFACDICAKNYRSASMLSTHKLRKHYRLAKYTCEQCGKKFVDLERLDLHKEIHVVTVNPTL